MTKLGFYPSMLICYSLRTSLASWSNYDLILMLKGCSLLYSGGYYYRQRLSNEKYIVYSPSPISSVPSPISATHALHVRLHSYVSKLKSIRSVLDLIMRNNLWKLRILFYFIREENICLL